jgi:hypothetical protein
MIRKRSYAVEGEEPKSTRPQARKNGFSIAHSSSTEISGQLLDETEQLRTVLTPIDLVPPAGKPARPPARPPALRPEIKSSLKQGKTTDDVEDFKWIAQAA